MIINLKPLGISGFDSSITIAELAAVKDTDFDHFVHLLSGESKNPPPKRRA
jgi:hypothetical protein